MKPPQGQNRRIHRTTAHVKCQKISTKGKEEESEEGVRIVKSKAEVGTETKMEREMGLKGHEDDDEDDEAKKWEGLRKLLIRNLKVPEPTVQEIRSYISDDLGKTPDEEWIAAYMRLRAEQFALLLSALEFILEYRLILRMFRRVQSDLLHRRIVLPQRAFEWLSECREWVDCVFDHFIQIFSDTIMIRTSKRRPAYARSARVEYGGGYPPRPEWRN